MRFARILLVAIAIVLAAPASETLPGKGIGPIVIDAGHGGGDLGARGFAGLVEKDLALRVARQIGSKLAARGFEVAYTRTNDRFLTLSERTDIANRVHGSLYLSIHANTAEDHDAQGPETYFLSLKASDEDARRVAMSENRVFEQENAVDDGDDIVGNILGDLILTDHLRASSRLAAAIQKNLAGSSGPDRGVRQAPFVVLMGVNMPAVLVEIGFVTNREEARRLRTREHQGRIADAVVRAVESYRSTRYGDVARGKVDE